MPANETGLVSAILQTLTAMGCWCHRVNTGARGRVHYGLGTGAPDILVLDRGKVLGLEVKSPFNETRTGKQSDAQRAWSDAWLQAGGHYAVVRSTLEAMLAVRNMRSHSLQPAPRPGHRSPPALVTAQVGGK
jgi:hypothetical protein